jgi:hypothetical protein
MWIHQFYKAEEKPSNFREARYKRLSKNPRLYKRVCLRHPRLIVKRLYRLSQSSDLYTQKWGFIDGSYRSLNDVGYHHKLIIIKNLPPLNTGKNL